MSSFLRTLALGFAISLAVASARAVDRLEPVHLVFDIDWTLASNIPDSRDLAVYAGDPHFFEVEGKYYRLSNGVPEAINRLLDFNRRLGYEYVKISFFSGGGRARNEALLKKIILDPATGRSAFDVAEKVLSFEDLTDLYPQLPRSADVAFADRYEKNLVLSFKNPERTIAIDDTKKFFRGDLEKSLLWIGETYSDFPTLADVALERAKFPEEKYLPADLAAWETDQNRILIASLELEYALQSELDAAKKGQGAATGAFRDRVQSINRKFTKTELLGRVRRIYPARILRRCSALLAGGGGAN